jgi:hypothetical protein
MVQLPLIILSSFFSLTRASHFLGGSFTFRQDYQTSVSAEYTSFWVEIRFHMTDHYFICTPEYVNNHILAYLIPETVRYDAKTKEHLWFQTNQYINNRTFYDLQCTSYSNGNDCVNFNEKIWAYCESANQKKHYAILRRQFFFTIPKTSTVDLQYVRRAIRISN